MAGNVIQLGSGLRLRARGPAPYRYCKVGILHLVLDGNKNNCVTFPDEPGSVSFGSEQEARDAAKWLNGSYK